MYLMPRWRCVRLSTFLSSTVYRGHEGVVAWYSETYEPWVQMRAEPQRFVDVGERTVVVVGLHARVSFLSPFGVARRRTRSDIKVRRKGHSMDAPNPSSHVTFANRTPLRIGSVQARSSRSS